jgi:hypothetical protein
MTFTPGLEITGRRARRGARMECDSLENHGDVGRQELLSHWEFEEK